MDGCPAYATLCLDRTGYDCLDGKFIVERCAKKKSIANDGEMWYSKVQDLATKNRK
jgi:hypothetical protein